MNIDKIYSALQSLPLPIEQKTLLIEAFTSGESNVQQVETPQQEDTRLEELTKQVEQLKKSVEKLTKQLDDIVIPVKATKDNEGLVRAITDIKNLEVSTATIPIVVGAINTLLVKLRTAGIIQM